MELPETGDLIVASHYFNGSQVVKALTSTGDCLYQRDDGELRTVPLGEIESWCRPSWRRRRPSLDLVMDGYVVEPLTPVVRQLQAAGPEPAAPTHEEGS